MDYTRAVIEFIREGLWLFVAWTGFILFLYFMPDTWQDATGVTSILDGDYGPWIVVSGILSGFLSLSAVGRRLWLWGHDRLEAGAGNRLAKQHYSQFKRLPDATRLVIGRAVNDDLQRFPCSLEQPYIQDLLDLNWGYLDRGGYHFSHDIWQLLLCKRREIRQDFAETQKRDPVVSREVLDYMQRQRWPRFY